MIPEELTQFIKNFDCLLLPETCMRNDWMSALAGQAASTISNGTYKLPVSNKHNT